MKLDTLQKSNIPWNYSGEYNLETYFETGNIISSFVIIYWS